MASLLLKNIYKGKKTMTASMTDTVKNLNVEELKLLARQSGPCVSIQIPAYQPGAGGGSRQAYLRQLTHKAEEALRNMDRPEDAERAAAALESLIQKLPVEHGGPGLALFCAPGFEAAFETPVAHEHVVVGDHFYLLPHIAAAQTPRDFFVVGLSRNHLRLFHYQSGRCTELPLPAGVPASLEQAGAFDQEDHTVEGRSSAGPSVGAMRGVRFGVSGDHDSEAEYLRHYFEAVDKGLRETLRGSGLFLAGVQQETSLYRKAAKHPNIFEAECHGNPEHSSLDQIAKHARAGAARQYRFICDRAIQGLSEVRNKVTGTLDVFYAVNAGRVHKIFVAEEPRLPSLQADALNATVVIGLRNGADVFTYPGAEIPGFGPIVAVLRY